MKKIKSMLEDSERDAVYDAAITIWNNVVAIDDKSDE